MVVKANSKGQGILSLVVLSGIDELYDKLQGSKDYSPLDCTLVYHHSVLSDKVQMKVAFVTSMRTFEFKKIPFGLV